MAERRQIDLDAEAAAIAAREAERERANAQAAEAADPDRKPLDETVPGGRYLVNGQVVDAEGRPVKD